MINESSMTDLMGYRRVVLSASTIVLLVIGIFAVLAWYADWVFLLKPLAGAFLGSMMASLNVLALAYAFFALAIKKSPRRVILWPVASFLLMCGTALLLALRQPDYILGFALGLTTPLIFGAIIALRA
jgi:hypothetical protein